MSTQLEDPNIENLSKRIDLLFSNMHQIKREVSDLNKSGTKDELFEKFNKLCETSFNDTQIAYYFNKRELFDKAKKLGLFTMALDDFWKKYCKATTIGGNVQFGNSRAVYEEIHTKYSAKGELDE